MSRQEIVQVVNPAAPPVLYVGRLQPADVEAHVDGRDELLPSKGLLRGRHYAGLQGLSLTHDTERNPADAAVAAGSHLPP